MPYKEQFKWWSSVELGRRVVLVLFIVSFPHNQVIAIVKTIVVKYFFSPIIMYSILQFLH